MVAFLLLFILAISSVRMATTAEPVAEPPSEPAAEASVNDVDGADDVDKGGADDSTELSTASVLPEQLAPPAVDAEAASAGPSLADLEAAAALIQGAAASAGPGSADLEAAAALIQGAAASAGE